MRAVAPITTRCLRFLLAAGTALVAPGLAAPPAGAQPADQPEGQPARESRNTGRIAARQPPGQTDVRVIGHVYQPRLVPASPERIDDLQVPDGFQLSVFARDLGNPRIMAVAGDGTVYVTRRATADLLMLRDTDGDGAADERQVVTARPHLHGIALDGRTLYLAGINTVYRAELQPDGTPTEPDPIIDDLPDAGQHPNRTLAVGPDGRLFITVGSTCNACAEPNPENATILRAEPDGSARSIHASGLRNTIGIDWHPKTGELFGFDHGIDWLGDNEQQEELNRITQGGVYGWPYIYADGKENPADEPPAGISMADWKRMSTDPVGLYTAHAAPMQFAFYKGNAFPAEYQGDGFATMRGSWNRKPPSGYEVVRVRFDDQGQPQGIEPFLTGFLREGEDGHHEIIGRPVGLAVTPDGALLVGDDTNGVIYRVSASDPRVAGAGGTGTGGSGAVETDQDVSDEVGLGRAGTPLPPGHGPTRISISLPSLQAEQRLDVSSPDIPPGGMIPEKYSDYGQGFSPPLSWQAGPEGTQSYTLLMEDPDAAQPSPYIHWVAYNIPGDTTRIRGALPGTPELQEPVSLMQGRNSRGSTGYFGPRPPGSEPHAYHFQVFALDRQLDLPPGASRAEVLQAMEGHVLAQGELVGRFARPPGAD